MGVLRLFLLIGLASGIYFREVDGGLTGNVCSYMYNEYYTTCGFACWSRHGHYRYVTKYKCCPGYSLSGEACNPICSISCKNGGSCIAPETCKCRTGYTGSDCSKPVCSPPCQNNGRCVSPNRCSCTQQYNGTHCETPVCKIHCFNKGTCIAPDVCKCGKHWTDDHCTTPVCNPPCTKAGVCINPNECRYPTLSETDKACHDKKLDVSFVVDTSSSIGEDNFQRMKNFIKTVVGYLGVSYSLTHVSLIEFGLEPKVQFQLTDFVNKTEIIEAIDNTTFSGGATSTSDAIEMMRQQGFTGERPVAPDVGIVITDGLSKYPRLTRAQAELAKQEGITMLAVGIGQVASHTELFGIASGLSRVFEVADFKKLVAIGEDVARTICEVELPTDYAPRTTTPPTTTPDGCIDIDNCTSYARDMCFDYNDWASDHCARTCGYCDSHITDKPTECKDNIDSCDQYGKYMCLDGNFFEWANKNCAVYCGYCGNKTDEVFGNTIETTTALSTTSTPPVCKDLIENCADYGGPSICNDPTFIGWATINCPKYCGMCFNLRHYDANDAGTMRCPSWDLPEECSLEYKNGTCCPFPDCPPDLRLTVKRQ